MRSLRDIVIQNLQPVPSNIDAAAAANFRRGEAIRIAKLLKEDVARVKAILTTHATEARELTAIKRDGTGMINEWRKGRAIEEIAKMHGVQPRVVRAAVYKAEQGKFFKGPTADDDHQQRTEETKSRSGSPDRAPQGRKRPAKKPGPAG